MLAPNRWMPARRTLETTIALDEAAAARVVVRERSDGRLEIRSDQSLTRQERSVVLAAISRMLRLHENLKPFHQLCAASATHRSAAAARSGRLLRSATLFEDIVKVICTCNVTWRQTVAMARRLVDVWGVPVHAGTGRLVQNLCPSKRGESLSTPEWVSRSFPTAVTLANASVRELQVKARLGYRAAYVHRLACDVASGRLNLASLEDLDARELYTELRRIHGIGNYGAANLCMLLGHYDRLAIDTEMMRFLRKQHPRREWSVRSIETYYKRWQPYQFLAYWYELWQDYMAHHGHAAEWDPDAIATRITETGSS